MRHEITQVSERAEEQRCMAATGSRVRATAPTLGRVAFLIALPHLRGSSGCAATEDLTLFVSHSCSTGGEVWKLS